MYENFTALSSKGPELLPIEIFRWRNREIRAFAAVILTSTG